MDKPPNRQCQCRSGRCHQDLPRRLYGPIGLNPAGKSSHWLQTLLFLSDVPYCIHLLTIYARCGRHKTPRSSSAAPLGGDTAFGLLLASSATKLESHTLTFLWIDAGAAYYQTFNMIASFPSIEVSSRILHATNKGSQALSRTTAAYR